MPEQVVSTTRTYESPPVKTSSLSLIIAWLFIVIILLSLVALYVVYFINADSYTYGIPWKSNRVADTTATINPIGQNIYFVNGASSTRNSNPDYLYVGRPSKVPYINRTFIIFNTSSSNQLELRPSTGIITTLNDNPIGSFFIQPLTSVTFLWYDKDTIIPLTVGSSPTSNN